MNIPSILKAIRRKTEFEFCGMLAERKSHDGCDLIRSRYLLAELTANFAADLQR
jgi:hypothetical protein